MRTLQQILYSLQEADNAMAEVACLQELREHEDYPALLEIVQKMSDAGFFLEVVSHELAAKVLGPSVVEQTFSPVKWSYCAGVHFAQKMRDGEA